MLRDKRSVILAAATRMFSQHGLRRASMDLIAEQAQVAKPTLYAYFGSKDDLFAAVCEDVGKHILAAARAAAEAEADLVERVAAVLAAKFTVVFELIQSSPYAQELLHPASKTAQESIAAADAAFRQQLTHVLASSASAHELDLSVLGLNANELATQLMHIGYGASYGAASADEQRQNLRALVATLLRSAVSSTKEQARARLTDRQQTSNLTTPMSKAKPKAEGTSRANKPRKSPPTSKTPQKAEAKAKARDLSGWREETLARMRALILEADPEMVEEVKWRKPSNSMTGVPVWSHHGLVCTGETYKEVVKLKFAHGASLPDPSRLFNSSLEGNTRRAIDIREGQKVDARAFKALVKAAVAQNIPPVKKR